MYTFEAEYDVKNCTELREECYQSRWIRPSFCNKELEKRMHPFGFAPLK